MMKRILTIFGNRPQFIKSYPVSQALRKAGYLETLVNTGQHFDTTMSDVFFQELSLATPKYNLNINRLSDLLFIAECIKQLEPILQAEQPEIVLVYGDTNTTLSAAIATKKLNFKLAHIEAGPRLGDLTIPEEYNRVLVDHSADLLFAPDMTSVNNLKQEGLAEERIIFSGDIMLDIYLEKENLFSAKAYQEKYGDYIVCTFHRQENVDCPQNLAKLCAMLTHLEKNIIFPLHPRTKHNLEKYQLYASLMNAPTVHLLPPLSYSDMMSLIKGANFVLTDSGGLQKEAFFAGIPCYVFLNTTPWPEIQKLGWQKVMGSFSHVNCDYFFTRTDFSFALRKHNDKLAKLAIFGSGKAAQNIVNTLQNISTKIE